MAAASECNKLPARELARNLLPFESAIMAECMTEKILRRVDNIMFLKSLDRNLPIYSALVGVSTLKEVVKAEHTSRDEGEKNVPNASWAPSIEPTPKVIDNCARCSMAIQGTCREIIKPAAGPASKAGTKLKSRAGDFARSSAAALKQTASAGEAIKRPNVYKVKYPPVGDEREERLIGEMRTKRIYEETKRLEDQRQEEQARKRRLDRYAGGNPTYSKKKTDGLTTGNFVSYTMAGTPVDVQLVTQFTNIAPKCSPGVKETAAVKQRLSYLGAIPKPPAKKPQLNNPTFADLMKAEADTLEIVNKRAAVTENVLPRVYETLIPSVGVTFTELGKKVKGNRETVAEQMGRVSKEEFGTMISQLTRVPSFLPALSGSKPKKTLSESASHTLITLERTLPVSNYVKERNFEVTGDLSQLLITQQIEQDYFDIMEDSSRQKEPEYSVLPGILPKIRTDVVPRPTVPDAFNIRGIEEKHATESPSKPIERGAKVTMKQITRSLGFLKKLPRMRLSMRHEGRRLPPPPIGTSFGHGIVQH